MGKITDNSYVMCVAKAQVNNRDVFFLPTLTTYDDTLVWVSATPDNIPAASSKYFNWLVFKTKSTGNGDFSLNFFKAKDFTATDTPELVDASDSMSVYNFEGTDTLSNLRQPGNVIKFTYLDDVALNHSGLWCGVWYQTVPSTSIVGPPITGTNGWAGIANATDGQIFGSCQYMFFPCGGVNMSKLGVCSTLKFFEPFEYINGWITGDENYTLKNCYQTPESGASTDMHCLYGGEILQVNNNFAQCNGFRQYRYGKNCSGDVYADSCRELSCLYGYNNSLACQEVEGSGKQQLAIIFIAIAALIVFLVIIGMVVFRRRKSRAS